MKIVIDNNNLSDYIDSNISISNKRITFLKSGDYTLEYVSSNNISLDIEVFDNVVVNLFVVSCSNDISISNRYRLGSNSKLVLYKFYDNYNTNENIVIDLDGEGSSINYNFSSISSRLDEYHIIVNHNNNKVSSNISNKCIGLDNSKIKLEIDSIVKKGNIDTVMNQNSRILTLGSVDASIIPNMFCDDDSVEARHGSIIGKIGDSDLFYLMSRGISEDEAISLLVKGFIFSNLVLDMDKRAMIFHRLQSLER